MVNRTEPALNVIVATDCGSTTTKAILIENVDGHYRQTFRGEAPTTVEAPFEDVTRGVLNAMAELEELSGRTILDGDRIITPADGHRGVDIYISTSSAGGGLQMMVAGAVKTMTAQSAERAALGAGAIVMDVLASNDGRRPHEKIEQIRLLRPDMVLLSGGTDGGTVTHVVELAEYIAAARPRPRLGRSFLLPVIYAGNKDARGEVRKVLEKKTELSIVDNIRPTLEQENLTPARQKVQDLFMEHVMAQAPGYDRLTEWTGAPIMPTPGAVGEIMQAIARRHQIRVVGVDIGGATTDVFSVFDGTFNRTVSANLGMSYSISNVMAEAGWENVMRWVPFDIDPGDLQDRIKNKMIRPTTIPQSLESLQVEQALAREALRLAFVQHRQLAVGLRGVRQQRTISEAFAQTQTGLELIDMQALDLLVGSGGILSHAPRRAQSMLMLIDGFGVEGITRIAVDSIFMMPHLGVLATVHERAATEVFEKDCLIHLGTCVAATGKVRAGSKLADIELALPNGQTQRVELVGGQMAKIPLAHGQTARLQAEPQRGVDLGAGRGVRVEMGIHGGVVGIVLDGRGRPIAPPTDPSQRREALTQWYQVMECYPDADVRREGS